MKFKVGSVVRQAFGFGGSSMTVVEVGFRIHTAWFDSSGSLHRDKFIPAELVLLQE